MSNGVDDMRSLHIVATLHGAIAVRSANLMLDALLMSATATRDGLPPPPPIRDIPIPVAKSPCGRVHLATQGFSKLEQAERRWKNRRFPIAEAQMFGDAKLKRINITGGPCRSYRIPLETSHVANDEIEWWCVGHAREVEALLTGWVGYLGHRRAVGLGRVMHWHVEECEPWDGFPVVRDGRPMRPLPIDYPGLAEDVERAIRCVAPPYWRRAEEELCAVPAC